MLDLVPSLDRLTEIFNQSAAPAFFLFATSAVMGVMDTRLTELNKHLRDLKRDSALSDELIQNFSKRSDLLRRGIFDSVVASALTISLLINLFLLQFFSVEKAYGSTVLFALAACAQGVGLVRLAQEAWLAMRQPHL